MLRQIAKAGLALSVCTLAACATAPQPGAEKELTPSTAHRPSDAVASTERRSSSLKLCKMAISNPPPAGVDGTVAVAAATAFKGVKLLTRPATNVCLSSGYGARNGKPHRGVDYYASGGGDVIAAAAGTVKEATMRADFGNMIVIDHGGGVFTRYAHLANFAPGVKVGSRVAQGDRLGAIGATGATSVVHLHFEVLSGSYVSGAGSFGLQTHDIFSLGAHD